MKKYYITTPIYYVNDKPHIGSFYTSLLVDIFARFLILFDNQIKILTGVDEHGQKVQQSSNLNNILPQAHCDRMSSYFKQMLLDFNLSFSYDTFDLNHFDNSEFQINNTFNNKENFIRTTSLKHKNFVQKKWMELYNNGWIYKGVYSGFYSFKDESYYSKEELVDGLAPTGSLVEYREEECYFFKLSIFTEYLENFYNSSNVIIQSSKMNEVKAFLQFIKSKKEDLAISRLREKISWGIEVPNDKNHTIYVWLDALFNYLSIFEEESDYDTFWNNSDSMKIHFIGKEIVKFHAVYWPAFIIGTKISYQNFIESDFLKLDLDLTKALFSKIFIHNWWLNDGKKISKSDGNIINPYEEIEWIQTTYSIEKNLAIDYLKFFLSSSFKGDSDMNYSRSFLVDKINSLLVNNFGNLLYRSLILYKKLIQLTPDTAIIQDSAFKNINDTSNQNLINIKLIEKNLTKNFDLYKIIEIFESHATLLNKYIDIHKPWDLIKEAGKELNLNKKQELYDKAYEIIFYILYQILDLTFILSPFCPYIARKILEIYSINLNDLQKKQQSKDRLNFNININKIGIILHKLEINN